VRILPSKYSCLVKEFKKGIKAIWASSSYGRKAHSADNNFSVCPSPPDPHPAYANIYYYTDRTSQVCFLFPFSSPFHSLQFTLATRHFYFVFPLDGNM
jgi:hypothetical protein